MQSKMYLGFSNLLGARSRALITAICVIGCVTGGPNVAWASGEPGVIQQRFEELYRQYEAEVRERIDAMTYEPSHTKAESREYHIAYRRMKLADDELRDVDILQLIDELRAEMNAVESY